MKTFTFTDRTSHQLLQDLNEGRTVKLAKENGSAVILRDGNDIDEFGDNIYRMTIQPAQGEPIVKSVPMNATDMFHFLMYEKFTQYEITTNKEDRDMTTRIHGGDFNYSRLHDIMLTLMCWNWDFEMDTCNGILTIPGYSRAEFITCAVEDRGQLIPEDLEFELGTDSSDVILKVAEIK